MVDGSRTDAKGVSNATNPVNEVFSALKGNKGGRIRTRRYCECGFIYKFDNSDFSLILSRISTIG